MKVLYFAWLRERLNTGEQDISPPDTVQTVADLIDWLSAGNESAALAFENRTLIKAAINEELVDHNTSLSGAKTVAFFPPMTGG